MILKLSSYIVQGNASLGIFNVDIIEFIKGYACMKIIDHRLYHDDETPYPFRPSPNIGGELNPDYLVMHYTAGRNAEQSVNWLTNRTAKASAHLVIGRDASITQLVEFNRVAWHAGRSQWQGLKGLNKYSIGIELDNTGPLTRSGDQWLAWFGDAIAPESVIEAAHKFEDKAKGWQLYTPEQLFVALEVSGLLAEHYNLKDIIGHEDIAPRRKRDPGPAFPMDTFRARLFGRDETAEDDADYETAANLNIRTGAGSNFETLPVSPLPEGTRLDVLKHQGSWVMVDVLDTVNGEMDVQGWVHGRYIRRTS